MTSQKSKNKTANNGGYNGTVASGTVAEVKPLEALKDQVAKKEKEDKTGYVGGRINSRQMKLFLAFATTPEQKRAIKSLCGVYDQKKTSKKAA
jgi:hypothetical protein